MLGKNMKFDQEAAMKEVDRTLLVSDEKIMHPVIASKFDTKKFQSLRTLEQIL
jgi:hypothetical protein